MQMHMQTLSVCITGVKGVTPFAPFLRTGSSLHF
jgi:hypothetical protein